ncbi:hypothetical protein CR513_17781, partial [Mucuna pruriens]
MIARVLIDNGSSVNVPSKATLDKLTSMDAQLGASSVVVRAFDGSKREVMGEITLPILIGPAMSWIYGRPIAVSSADLRYTPQGLCLLPCTNK